MGDNLEILIAIFALVVFMGIFMLPFVLFFIYVFYQNGKRKGIRSRVLSEQQDFISGCKWFPVRYASAPRFASWLKIFPWDGAGILVMGNDGIRFLGQTFSGNNINVQFSPANSRLNWLGKCPWPNGAVSWFEFEASNAKHYFSSETGPFVFGSSKSTKEIYEHGSRAFGQAHLTLNQKDNSARLFPI